MPLPPSLPLLKETIERIAAFTNTKLDRLEMEGDILRVRRGIGSENVRLEGKGYRTGSLHAGDQYVQFVPNTSGMAMLAVTGSRFLTPEEEVAREIKDRQAAMDKVASEPLLHGVAALLEYNTAHRKPIDVHATFADRPADEVDDAIRRFKLMWDGAASVASARRRSRHHDPELEEFKRVHPGFSHANYYRAVMSHEWRLIQAART
jgi:hypothetical protein